MNGKQSGVALVLVLMVTGVLALLMLQFALTAREHTGRAQKLVARATADLALQSAKAQTLFLLLTKPLESTAGDSESGRPEGWNFLGRPFQVGAAEVALQDLNGLVPMTQPGDPLGDYARMLRAVGVPPERVRVAVARLGESLAPPLAAPLQELDELAHISGLTAAEIARLRDITTLYPVRLFNPLTATPGALQIRYADTTLQSLLTLRERNKLDAGAFASVTGQGTDELLAFIAGPGFRVTMRVSSAGVVAAEELTITVLPYGLDPLDLWSQRRPLSAESIE